MDPNGRVKLADFGMAKHVRIPINLFHLTSCYQPFPFNKLLNHALHWENFFFFVKMVSIITYVTNVYLADIFLNAYKKYTYLTFNDTAFMNILPYSHIEFMVSNSITKIT